MLSCLTGTWPHVQVVAGQNLYAFCNDAAHNCNAVLSCRLACGPACRS